MKTFFFLTIFSLFALTATLSNYEIYDYDGRFAFLVNGNERTQEEPKACPCNGSKKSGDGLGPCQCGVNCPCKKSLAEENVSRQVVYVGSKTCGPCRVFERKDVPELVKRDWRVSPNEDAHIRILSDESAETYKITAFPTYILFVGGKEVKREVGYMTYIQVSHFYYE